MKISLKGERKEIIFDLVSRKITHAGDYWKDNWINTDIRVVLPGYTFHAREPIHINTWYIFLRGLKRLYRGDSDIAELNMESRAVLVRGQSVRSHTDTVRWLVKTTYPSENGISMIFDFTTPSSIIRDLMLCLEEVLSKFPIQGVFYPA